MGQPFRWPEPRWLAEIDPQDRAAAEVKFYLALAAAYCTEKGSVEGLGRACTGSASRVRVSRKRGSVSPKLAIEIERQLGRELFPRELFRPDLFETGE